MSYKSKKKKTLPKSNWDIVKNTHEALVDRITFERVQDNVKRTNRTINTNREKRLFENLIFCRECGNTLTVSYRKIITIGLLIVIDIQETLEEECVSLILCHTIN